MTDAEEKYARIPKELLKGDNEYKILSRALNLVLEANDLTIDISQNEKHVLIAKHMKNKK